MRNLKKFLALVLAFVMAMSLMVTVNAASDDFADSKDINEKFLEAVEVLTGMGVFQGTDESGVLEFKPQSVVTRAQMAAVVYRLATGDAEDARAHLYSKYATFTDVSEDAWYAGYVGYCADAEIIAGYPDGSFKPSKAVTGYEALKMLLCAVGWGQNGEFEGTGWTIRVGTTATGEGLLGNVNSSTYEYTLNDPALREMLAEVSFQAAQVPTVVYQYGSYNKYNNLINQDADHLNPSLGYKYYGLSSYTGAVVGNDATGEDYTLLSMKATAVYTGSTPKLTDVKINDGSVSYVHGTSNKAYNASDFDPSVNDTHTDGGTVTLAFNEVTGLDLFGHKATIWYDCRTSAGTVQFGDGTNTVDIPSAYRTTYAVVDKVNLVKTVFATSEYTEQKDSDTAKTSIYSAAVAAGFSKTSAPAVESKIFDQFSAVSNAGTPTSATATKSKVGMYRIISNSASLNADVVISLNQEVAEITQRNSTVKDGEYIYLGTGNSFFGDDLGGGDHGGKLLDSQLSATSDKTLGDIVTANQVVGTAYGTTTCNLYGTTPGTTPYKNSTGTEITAAASAAEDMLYDTQKLEPAFTGTISTYKLDSVNDIDPYWISQNGTSGTAEYLVTKVTLTDGKSYDLSGITGSAFPYGFDATASSPHSHMINGMTPLTSASIAAGMTYSFYLDEVGRFIGVAGTNEYEFLYTTFADYEVGGLGTGTISYYAYGVDWDGNIVKTNNQIKTITLPVDGAKVNSNSIFEFEDNVANIAQDSSSNGYVNFRGATLPVGYNALPVTMKDQGSSEGIGNRIKAGDNTRFLMDGNGNMTWYPVSGAKNGNRFIEYWDTTANTTSGTWTITASDARNGFARVYSTALNADGTHTTPTGASTNVDYLLTDSTKFIVVTGSGTADLAVEFYTGLTGLLDGGSSADITYDGGDNIYFLTEEQQYGNVDTDSNRTISTVIMSDTNLNQYGALNLYFAAPSTTATGVKLNASNTGSIEQYELYSNGEASYYWVDTDAGDGAVGTDASGKFYTLVQIDTIAGQPIYRATDVTGKAGYGNKVGQQYNYITVGNVNTADVGGTVYKVGDAIVAEAFGKNTISLTNGTNGIDTVEKLNNAVSMGQAGTSGNLYNVSVAIVYSGINVSCIYVTNIQ